MHAGESADRARMPIPRASRRSITRLKTERARRALLSTDAFHRLEHARRQVYDRINRQPRQDDEIPIKRIFADIDEAFTFERAGENQDREYYAVGKISEQMPRVQSEQHPDGRA